MNKREIIPIAILHRNEPENLSLMIKSIKENTKIPYHIFVIDNNSSDAAAVLVIQELKNSGEITLIESKRNNWVLGFNHALQHEKWPGNSKYYVFSDADIIVPPPSKAGKCWLELMLDEMERHACIGKLGISLKVDDIDNQILSSYAKRQREIFDKNPKIGDNSIAPVDTTLAIYRNNFFIGTKFKFSIGHASLARPYYFTCRTAASLEARHLGWYVKSSLEIDGQKLKEKVRCFAIYGGGIADDLLSACNFYDAMYYKILRPLSLLYWSGFVLIKNFIYIAARFPRGINEIQSNYR